MDENIAQSHIECPTSISCPYKAFRMIGGLMIKDPHNVLIPYKSLLMVDLDSSSSDLLDLSRDEKPKEDLGEMIFLSNLSKIYGRRKKSPREEPLLLYLIFSHQDT